MRQLILTYRFLRNNLKLSLINLSCMATGLVAVGIISGFVYQEFNYDSGNKNSDRIFRVLRKDGEMMDPYTHAPLAQALKSEVPGALSGQVIRPCNIRSSPSRGEHPEWSV